MPFISPIRCTYPPASGGMYFHCDLSWLRKNNRCTCNPHVSSGLSANLSWLSGILISATHPSSSILVFVHQIGSQPASQLSPLFDTYSSPLTPDTEVVKENAV